MNLRNEKFLIGCCYYPEHWNADEMKTDIENIKNMGFNVIRMGEFSWSMYEKNEGEYDFSLLKSAVELAKNNGLYVILGTPTATPPKWLVDKYPEVLYVDENLNVMHHGSRQYHNHTSEVYRDYCGKIVRKMAEAFKDCDNVIGWQIDNELNCHRNLSYAQSDNIAFRKWLKKKYETIERLNESWGTRFWSLEFNDFSQITCPYPTTTHKNPGWYVDFLLFSSDSVIDYAKIQYDILKEVTPDKFITHNGIFDNLDYDKFTHETVDFMSYDSYPSFTEQNEKMGGRQRGYKLSKVRGLSNDFLILEQQSGPGGQLKYLLPTPEPGQIRLWTYQSIAHGAKGVLYFRWRTAIYGAEQLWYGIYDYDGEENYRSREIREIAKEINENADLLLKLKTVNDVAILYDYHNSCNNSIESFAGDDTDTIYNYLNSRNIKCDFIYNLDCLENSAYKIVIVPHLTIATKDMADKLQSFADRGGIVIISARSGVKDINNQYYRQTAPGVFRNLIGAKVEWFTELPSHLQQEIEFNGKTVKPAVYFEVLRPDLAEAVGVYKNRFCKDMPAFVENKNVYYLGTYFNKENAFVYEEIIKKHIDVPFYGIASCIEVFNYTDYTLLLNYSDERVELPHKMYDILTKTENFSIAPYGVILAKK